MTGPSGWVDSALNWLDARFGAWAIPNAVRALVLFQGIVWMLSTFAPPEDGVNLFLDLLEFRPEAILSGQVWRIFTFILLPPALSPLFVLISLWFLWWIGDGLESGLGPFRVNAYILLGIAGTNAAAFLPYVGMVDATGSNLDISLFLAFATLFPELEILLFFIIPVKIKWLGWFTAALLLVSFVLAPVSGKIGMTLCIANYLLFFGPAYIAGLRQHRAAVQRRQEFQRATAPASTDGAFHRCTTCGRTELTHPALSFRVTEDGEEYCDEHLGQATGPPGVTMAD